MSSLLGRLGGVQCARALVLSALPLCGSACESDAELPRQGALCTAADCPQWSDASVDSGSPAQQPGKGDAGDTPGISAGPTGLPCAVQEVVYTHCVSCHSDPPVGTYMPLLTRAHFQAQGTTDSSKRYFELADERIHSSDDPMPPADKPQLTDAERSILSRWFAQDAPADTEGCAEPLPDAGTPPPPPPEIDTTGLECHRFLAHAPFDKARKYKVGAATDAYINMVFAAPWQGTVYGIVLKPIVDNGPVLHHWILYREPGAGLDGQVAASGGQHTGGEMVHGWAPGGSGIDFRPYGDVGFELPSTTYTMEFHYNSSDANAEDASGVEVCIKREPPEHLAGLSWLGYDNGAESYVAGQILGTWASGNCLTPAAEWTGTCRPRSNEPIHIMFVLPHMHEAGRHMKSVINGPNGSRVLHDQAFDFSSQKSYEVNELLMPGETITTTCNFSEPKCAGQATTAEMCYLYAYAYPKGALEDNGPWGDLAHGGGTCLGQ